MRVVAQAFLTPFLASESHRREWALNLFTSLGSSALSRPQYPHTLAAGVDGWDLLVGEPECFARHP